MNTVTLYKVEVSRAYAMDEQGVYFSLTPWGKNTEYYEGEDSGPQEYNLPNGYTVAESNFGGLQIYDDHDQACTIVPGDRRSPQLVNGRGDFVKLKRAPASPNWTGRGPWEGWKVKGVVLITPSGKRITVQELQRLVEK